MIQIQMVTIENSVEQGKYKSVVQTLLKKVIRELLTV